MTEQPDYTIPSDLEVPEGHQATWRPAKDGGPAVLAVEPVEAEPKPDLSNPVVAVSVEAHGAQTRQLSEAEALQLSDEWAAEHARQLEQLRQRELEAAGDPTNIGPDGRPHFMRMEQTAEQPPAWSEVCGTCETEWPCQVYRDQHMADKGIQVQRYGQEPTP